LRLASLWSCITPLLLLLLIIISIIIYYLEERLSWLIFAFESQGFLKGGFLGFNRLKHFVVKNKL